MPDPGATALTAAEFTPDQTGRFMSDMTGGVEDPFDMRLLPEGTLQWRVKARYVALMDGERMAARAGILPVPVSVGENHFDVVGFGGVLVAFDRRGQGLARAVMAEATRVARTLGPALGLLWCFENRAGLYSTLGWHRVEHPVRVEQPTGPHTMSQVAMWTPLHPGAALPDGPVDVHSLPF